MVLSSVAGVNSPIQVKEIPKIENNISESSLVKRASNEEIGTVMSTENYIRKYFSDIPIMVQIAKCESTFRQLDMDGDVHRGKVNNADVGVMQINERYHLDKSVSENYDIYTIEGNTAYARELYEKYGTQPWSSSKACWGKYVNRDLAMNTKNS